ncbi:MAG: CoA transferase, partial [Acidimicrobiia bacterium]|nr:CoA transferase [Acidimicrobiia bacterium]
MTEHLDAHLHAVPMADRPTGPLVGLRILDLTHALAGPFGSMFLADLGADVIKVEPPTGELVRFAGPFTRDDEARLYGSRYAGRNRNKRSIALDLNVEADRETFLQLVETSDALLENQRAGVLDRLGVGWEVCHARNPSFVYAAVRGFGDPRTGASPYTDWPAFDPIAQAMGGIVASTGTSEDDI